ncbi:response regulator transcription factor [Devriesea agamarum]|uniref:response regulator transcription factor n=1 Tax=Devriesea agamarum TaxID=472569 RepID=UPI00071C9BF9|nr:response regulator transcription factor [Devriesea agamarum]
MTRVLLVDDQPVIRVGFRTILESEPGIDVIGEASNGQDAVDFVANHHVDVVCMDVQMPGMDGIEATRLITAAGGREAVLILTTFDNDDFLFSALNAGASGFLLKTAGADELIHAVLTLANGEALLSPQVTRRVIERSMSSGAHGACALGRDDTRGARALDDGGRAPVRITDHLAPSRADQPSIAQPVFSPHQFSSLPATASTQVNSGGDPGSRPAIGSAQDLLAQLTTRERETLLGIARGLSNSEIAAEMFVGEATVKTHVSNVLMKLGTRDRIHTVIWAYEHGVVGD